MKWWLRNRAEDLDRELASDLALEEEEQREGGLSAEEARYAARRAFGNVAMIGEQAREAWGWGPLERFGQDVRYALRQLRRAPGFACAAILIMALGIGANVALFTVVRCVLLKPLPYQDPDRLAEIREDGGTDFPVYAVAAGIYAEWAGRNRSFSSLALRGGAQFNLSSDGGELPELLSGALVTANFLPTLGVGPALGRNFTTDEDQPGGSRAVLISWSLWQRRFGGDLGIVNQTLRLNRQAYTVVGVMPRDFVFLDSVTQIWMPARNYFSRQDMTPLDLHNFGVIGRLRPGVSLAQGQADLSAISLEVHNAHPGNPFIASAARVKPLLEVVVGDIRTPLYVLLAATGCMLLIACLNVANLLVARAAAQRKELAIRAALGAGRLRLLRERLAESLLLTSAGGVLGVALASGAVQWLVRARPDFRRVEAIHLDGAAVAFTVGLVALCVLLMGVIAAAGATGNRQFTALRETARGSSAGQGRTRLRRALLASEVGLTVVLLFAAGMLMKSYARLRNSDPGCVTENILAMRVRLAGPSYDDPAQRVNLFAALLERVRALPGVEAAGIARTVPGNGRGGNYAVWIVEHPPLPDGVTQVVSDVAADPGYFQAMGIPILRGRSFDPGQRLNKANETVINAAFARRYFPNEDPIGKHLDYRDRIWQIVGIVGDTRSMLAEDPPPIQYYPLYSGLQNNAMATLAVRSRGNVEQQAQPVQKILRQLDRDLAVSNVLTMDQLLNRNTADANFTATLLAGFSVLSLALAAAGIFGVLSYTVAQRANELGIRMALGAPRGRILAGVLADGMRPALLGLAGGVAASLATAQLIRSLLFKTQPLDPAVFVLVIAGMTTVAALACIAPAWRASRLDPMQVLRAE